MPFPPPSFQELWEQRWVAVPPSLLFPPQRETHLHTGGGARGQSKWPRLIGGCYVPVKALQVTQHVTQSSHGPGRES